MNKSLKILIIHETLVQSLCQSTQRIIPRGQLVQRPSIYLENTANTLASTETECFSTSTRFFFIFSICLLLIIQCVRVCSHRTISGRNQLPLQFWDLTQVIRLPLRWQVPLPASQTIQSTRKTLTGAYIVLKFSDKTSQEANYSVSVCWRLLSPITKGGVQSVPVTFVTLPIELQ